MFADGSGDDAVLVGGKYAPVFGLKKQMKVSTPKRYNYYRHEKIGVDWLAEHDNTDPPVQVVGSLVSPAVSSAQRRKLHHRPNDADAELLRMLFSCTDDEPVEFAYV